MSVVRAVLFDLDGTLVQTREASWRVFAKTNAALALGINSQAEFFRLLEDNMFHGLRKHCGDDKKAGEAAKHFLDLLQREYNPDFVPGMADIVKAFAGSCSLAVISSNSVATIRRILDREKLTHCFSHVFGGDVEEDKRACVRRFLSDRSYLVNRNCSPAYREDPEKQLLGAGAEFVAVWPQELVASLLPGGFSSSCPISPPADPASTCASGCSCGCKDNSLPQVAVARRQRRLAATAALEQRASLGIDGRRQDKGTGAPAIGGVDKRLLAALHRLQVGSRPNLR
jgi:phosphoglycolate phosphatase